MCLVRLCTGCHQICEMKNRSGNFRARRVIYSVRNSAQDNILKYIVGEQMCLVRLSRINLEYLAGRDH